MVLDECSKKSTPRQEVEAVYKLARQPPGFADCSKQKVCCTTTRANGLPIHIQFVFITRVEEMPIS